MIQKLFKNFPLHLLSSIGNCRNLYLSSSVGVRKLNPNGQNLSILKKGYVRQRFYGTKPNKNSSLIQSLDERQFNNLYSKGNDVNDFEIFCGKCERPDGPCPKNDGSSKKKDNACTKKEPTKKPPSPCKKKCVSEEKMTEEQEQKDEFNNIPCIEKFLKKNEDWKIQLQEKKSSKSEMVCGGKCDKIESNPCKKKESPCKKKDKKKDTPCKMGEKKSELKILGGGIYKNILEKTIDEENTTIITELVKKRQKQTKQILNNSRILTAAAVGKKSVKHNKLSF